MQEAGCKYFIIDRPEWENKISIGVKDKNCKLSPHWSSKVRIRAENVGKA